MHKSKLINLLKSLTPDELKRFDEFVHSPFHNKSQKVTDLFTYIGKEAPDFASHKLTKEIAFAKLFPGKKYGSDLSVVMAKLTKLLESFLVTLRFQTDEEYQKLLLLEELRERNQGKYYQWAVKDIETAKSKVSERSINYYYHQYMLEESLYRFTLVNKTKKLQTSIQQVLDAFDIYWMLNKLKYWCSILNRQNIFAAEGEFLLDELLMSGRERFLQQIPAIETYYTTLLALKEEENETHFQRLKQLLNEGTHGIPRGELSTICTIAMNYCVKKVIAGKVDYYKEIFDLYKFMLQEEILLSGRYIAPRHVKNIATIGLRLKEFGWTEQFIHEYRDKVAPQFRESVFNFNIGLLHFYKKEFTDAMFKLLQVDYIDIFYNIDSKTLLLRTYYELEETESLLSLADAFKAFIRTNKDISANNKKAYLNFIKFTVRLYKIKALFSKKSVDKLQKDIESTPSISDKQWLLDKVEELS